MSVAAGECQAASPRELNPAGIRIVEEVVPGNRQARCSDCRLGHLCLPCGMEPEARRGLDELPLQRLPVRKGEQIYREGQPLRHLYAVRSGSFACGLSTADGREQIAGFRMPGELLGLDAVAGACHASNARALEDSEICAIPYHPLQELGRRHAGVQQAVGRLISGEIRRSQGLLLLLGSMESQGRLASFLLDLSHRMKSRGYSATEFHLRMSRADIGSLLGMKLETVSRTFSAFQRQGIVVVDKKHVRILDLHALAQLAGVEAV